MRIAICDDDTNDINVIKSFILTHKTSNEIIEFTSALKLQDSIDKGVIYDLLFLDVQMPDGDGWVIAKQLKRNYPKLYIAMVTVLNEFIYNCFDRVDWFAPKPVCEERVHAILDNAISRLYPKAINIKSEGVNITLTAREIYYAEVKQNITCINTIDRKYKLRMPLKKVNEILSPLNCFVQTHNSYIINLGYYESLSENCITLKNKSVIPLSRSYKKSFFEAVSEYIKN